MKTKLHKIIVHMSKLGIYVLIALMSLTMLLANGIHAQRKLLSEIFVEVGEDNKSIYLIDIFEEIEGKTNLKFAYSKKEVKNKVVTVNSGSWKMDELLKSISLQAEVSFRRVNEQIGVSMEIPSGKLPELVEEIEVQISVEGIVTDENGEGLPAATILEKGKTNGTTTDINGKFSLNVADQATLIISFVGYKSQEIVVGDQTNIGVSLELDSESLQEVVVVGYGTRSKALVTGSIASIDMEKTNDVLPNTNIAQSLVQIPGLQLIGNGRPGQGGSILVRGQSSLSAGTNPLIVLDGIIFEGELSDINPQDIESIDVLKDAASASIYGSKAANGVIMITSVRGTTSKPKIQINSTYGISESARWIDLMDAEGYVQRKLDFYSQSGNPRDPSNPGSYLEPEEVINYQNGISHDPLRDIISRQGSLTTFNVSLSGMSERTNYLLSTSLSNDQGLIKGDQENRVTMRINIDNQVNDWLTIGTTSTFVNRNLSGIAADLGRAYRNSPLGTFFYPDGSVTYNPVPTENASYNPLYDTRLSDNDETRQNLFSNIYAIVDFPFLDGLSYRVNYSPNFQWAHNYTFMHQDPNRVENTTNAVKENINSFRWVLENILTYEKNLGDGHDIDLTLLYGRNHYELESTAANANQFDLDFLGFNNFGLGSNYVINAFAEESELISSMARLNYVLQQKYLFTFTVRRDGSSVFGDQNKYASFPSVAVSWIASEEQFFQNINSLDFLKLRLSYGLLGNGALQPYLTKSLNATSNYVFGDGGASTVGIITTQTLGNESLRWETVYSTNLGIDFGLFGGRLNGSLDYYNNVTRDLLVQQDIPEMNGYTDTWTNVGQLNNKGFEVALSSTNIQSRKFQWLSTLSFSYNNNKIVKLFGDIDGDGQEDDYPENDWFIGEDINSFYDYEFDGIYQVGDNIPTGFQPGDVRVKDLNDDGVITPEDRTVIGHGTNPRYAFTITNTLNYGNLSLFVSVNSMLDWTAPYNLINPLVPGRAFNAVDEGYWTPENQSNSRPSLIYTNPLGTSWYFSRDFLRIRDIALSYDFKKLDLGMLSRFTKLSLNVSVKNLATITKWLGPDPESSGAGGTSNQGTDNLWPMPRIYSIGLNLGF